MINTIQIQLISMQKAKAYLDKKERQKEVRKNRITKLASVLFDKLFFVEGGTCKMMIPKNTLAGLKRYVKDRIHPGGFLIAVLENNLRKSFGQADKKNREALFEIVCHCYNELPSICWGSPEKVKNWLLRKEEIGS